LQNNLLAGSICFIGISIWFAVYVALAFAPDSAMSALQGVPAKTFLLLVSGAFIFFAGVVIFRLLYIPSVVRVAAHGCGLWFFISVFIVLSASFSIETNGSFLLDMGKNAGAVVDSQFQRSPGDASIMVNAAATALVGMLLLTLLYLFVARLEKQGVI
jgi:hypothetical protein